MRVKKLFKYLTVPIFVSGAILPFIVRNKGQLIAHIDSTFLIQSVKDAEANLERAKAQYTDSRRNLDRVKILLERGLESQLNYDASLITYESNVASLKFAQAALDRAKINLAYAYILPPSMELSSTVP